MLLNLLAVTSQFSHCTSHMTDCFRLATVSAGAAAGKFLKYEDEAPTVRHAPTTSCKLTTDGDLECEVLTSSLLFLYDLQVAAQTAYGIEAEVEGYASAYAPDLITFMDFRRHHSGVWETSAQALQV